MKAFQKDILTKDENLQFQNELKDDYKENYMTWKNDRNHK